MKYLILFSALILFIILIVPASVSAQSNCLTAADKDCNGILNTTELINHIYAWYACSSCVPDIFNSLQGYFHIPFCGDWSCNATVGEDCSTCSNDCGNCTAPQPNASFQQDYIAYWKFEGNLSDTSMYGNDGSCTNCPAYVAGQVGQAVDFDGIDDYVDAGSGSSLDNIRNLTVAFWVYRDNPNSVEGVISKNMESGWYVWLRDAGSSYQLGFSYGWSGALWGGGFWYSNAQLPSSQWYHVAITYDASSTANDPVFYLNGQIFGVASEPSSPSGSVNDDSPHSVYTGAQSTTEGFFNGSIDEVMIFNRSLSLAEIQQIFTSQGGTIPCSNDTGCLTEGSFCSGSTPYTCTLNASDGCLDRTDGTACLTGEKCSSGSCVPDPCYGITQCTDYLDSANCSANGCGVGGFLGCSWNSSSGVCEDVVFTYSGNWTAPIGIPYPSFGIEETVGMYKLQSGEDCTTNPEKCYDFGSGLQPYPDAGNGPYTHFVNKSHPSCIPCTYNNAPYQRNYDCGGNFGSPSAPLCDIPGNISVGSVVEIHGGPYSYGLISAVSVPQYRTWLYAYGTNTKPVFIRGVGGAGTQIYTTGWNINGGSYLIVENLDFYKGQIGLDNVDHISLRNLEIHGRSTGGGGDAIMVTNAQDNVIYNNVVYDNYGYDVYGKPMDYAGIWPGDYTQRLWIVDNEVYNNSGDSIIINACGGWNCEVDQGTTAPIPRYIYIGRNKLHDDYENAIDLKDSWHIIISQNEIYGYRTDWPNGDGEGDAVLGGNEGGKLAWILFNEIYDSVRGIVVDDEEIISTVYIIGNNLHDFHPVINDRGNPYGGTAVTTYRQMNIYVYNNIMNNLSRGFYAADLAGSDAAVYDISNNIIDDGLNGYGIVGEQYVAIDDGAAASNTLISNNLFHGSPSGSPFKWGPTTYYSDLASFQAATGKCAGCIEADPQFVDVANDDYHLTSGSPAIDSGNGLIAAYDYFYSLYGIDIKKDIEARTRPLDGDGNGTAEWDIGAYEY